MTVVPRRRRLLPLGLATATAALSLAGPALAADPEIVASGLDNPRGLAFGPWGLYVAEAGAGGTDQCFSGGDPEGGEICLGPSGAVTVVGEDGQRRVTTGLPSLASPGGNEALGPSDVSFAKDDHEYDERGFLTVGLAADPATREGAGDLAAGLDQLWRLHGDGYAHPVADLGAYETANNPDADQPDAAIPDSNPNSVAAKDGRHAYVADAGGNDVLYVHKRTGKIDLVGVLPPGEAPAPDIPGFPVPPGTPIPFQAVPTSVAIGHDGELYVGQLTGFPFPEGAAGVWVIRPGEDPVPFATGFTHITDVAVGHDGSLYIVQIKDTSLLGPDGPGSVIRVHPDGTRETVAEGLTAPYGIALKKGWAYVTTHSTEAGAGEVVRFPIGDDGDDHHHGDDDSDD
jgi:hypothetical protein